jgi:hypothetical protein
MVCSTGKTSGWRGEEKLATKVKVEVKVKMKRLPEEERP